jgi:hypothetical protein
MKAVRVHRTMETIDVIPASHYPGMTDEEIILHEQNLDLEAIVEIFIGGLEDNAPMVATQVSIVDTEWPTMTGPEPASDASIKDAMNHDENRFS